MELHHSVEIDIDDDDDDNDNDDDINNGYDDDIMDDSTDDLANNQQILPDSPAAKYFPGRVVPAPATVSSTALVPFHPGMKHILINTYLIEPFCQLVGIDRISVLFSIFWISNAVYGSISGILSDTNYSVSRQFNIQFIPKCLSSLLYFSLLFLKMHENDQFDNIIYDNFLWFIF